MSDIEKKLREKPYRLASETEDQAKIRRQEERIEGADRIAELEATDKSRGQTMARNALRICQQDERIAELEKAAEQVVFECEADDDAMMPSVAAVRNLKALIGGNE